MELNIVHLGKKQLVDLSTFSGAEVEVTLNTEPHTYNLVDFECEECGSRNDRVIIDPENIEIISLILMPLANQPTANGELLHSIGNKILEIYKEENRCLYELRVGTSVCHLCVISSEQDQENGGMTLRLVARNHISELWEVISGSNRHFSSPH